MLDLNTSSRILKDKIAIWANTKNIHPWLILESWDLPNTDLISKTKNIIIFGDYLASYIYLIEKNILDKNIFVLSNKSKRILIQLYPDNANRIHVINRYELYPSAQDPKPLPNINIDKFNFIYSGRISRSKNIQLILRVISILQTEYNPKIGLTIFGEFDIEPNLSTDRAVIRFSYKKEINDLLDSLPWTNKPQVLTGLGPEEWNQRLNSTDVLINLSRFLMEDFSVSSAQAQSQGNALVVSDIGGLSDIIGNNIVKIPGHLLGSQELTEDSFVSSSLAYSIVNYLVKNFKGHQTIFISENLIEHLVHLPSFEEIVNYNLLDYMNTPKGMMFIRKIEKVWKKSTVYTPPKKILFLFSKQQDGWKSLSQMMRLAEKFWIQFQDEQFSVDFFDSDKTLSKNDLFILMGKYEYIIAPALTPNIVSILKKLRNTLLEKIRIISYVHELPSIFFASLKLRGLEDFFQQSDIFITHCSADTKLTELSFIKPHVLKIPAHFIYQHEKMSAEHSTYTVKNFFYVGRISEQKSLHTLMCAVSMIQEEIRAAEVKFHIYGIHDHYGMPNLAQDASDYYDFLGILLDKLQIDDLFVFHGFKDINDWNKFAKKNNGIGIFPSIHSDENFGIAPYEFLKGGVPVMLTEWGGYLDLIEQFPDITYKIPVVQNLSGPALDITDLSQSILKIVTQALPALNHSPISDETFKINKVQYSIDGLKNLISTIAYSSEKLKLTPICLEAISKCRFSKNAIFAARTWPQNGKIYDSYTDTLILKSFAVYGMQTKITSVKRKEIRLLPWVEYAEAKYIVRDPIKGYFQFSTEEELVANGFVF